jgi:hypothetical protein
MLQRTIKIGLLLAGALLSSNAQWLNYLTPGTPMNRDGNPDLSAPALRVNGVPDLSGVWLTEPETKPSFDSTFDVPGDRPSTFSRYSANILADFKPEEAPIRPEAAELVRSIRAASIPSTVSRCLPMGLPNAGILSYAPFKIIQAPTEIVVLYENDNTHRQIYLDGRKLPTDAQPLWLGYSTAKWEDDTLVVDAAGFNDKTRLGGGYPHSESLHLQERFHRLDFGHMDVKVTIDDPVIFTKPFSITYRVDLLPNGDVLESFCNENEKDLAHIPAHRKE